MLVTVPPAVSAPCAIRPDLLLLAGALLVEAVEAEELAKDGEPTLPTTIGKERATNPFLRPSSPEIQKRLGMEGRELWEIFGETRRRKDRF